MNGNSGWICLYRDLLENPIWKCSTKEQKVILVTILLMANHDTNRWEWQGRKFEVKAGQFVTSLQSIADTAGDGITIQNVRTALKRFEKLGFLTNVSTKTGRLITIVNWSKYQDKDYKPNKEPNKDLTKTQQRPNKDLTPNNNDNNDNNDNKMMIVNNFCNEFENLTSRKITTSSRNEIEIIDSEILERILEEINQSNYLKANAEISWILKNISKILEGKYRDFKRIELPAGSKETKFHNFKQLSEDYDKDYLENLAKEKRKKLFESLS